MVGALLRIELVVGAELHVLAVVKYEQAAGLAERGQALCDGDPLPLPTREALPPLQTRLS